MAIYEEHKQRTRHDLFTARPYSICNCNVCLYLDAYKREMDKEEQAAYLESQMGDVPL